ncbi:hypothetical protein HQ489_04440 [Candidatus Woesearchaeota archaeon]|nr:hypothetical protein [Candidatus Woesearchaeota archaeon]
MSFNPEPLFPNEPKRPEKFPEDYEENLEEDCLSCGEQYGVHTTKQLVQCALNELRGISK